MRCSPTSVLSLVFAAVLGCTFVAGCSTDNETEADKPSNDAQSNDTSSSTEKKKTGESVKGEDAPPDFKPDFEPTTPSGGETDPNKDPAPPGAENQCIDKDDALGTESGALKLADTDDCNDDDLELKGVMKGAVDVDFYKFGASDKFGCNVEADFRSETAGTEICVFMRCKNSTVDAVTGCDQGTATTSDIGMKGCCAAAPGRAVPKWDCDGITDNDSADIFLRVRQPAGDKCLPYTVKYHF